MPSWELFEQQTQEYRDQVLPPDGHRPRVGRAGEHLRLGAVHRHHGDRIGMTTFGASAPLKELQKKFGFTVDHVVEAAHGQLAPAL